VKPNPGIRRLHSDGCPARDGGSCRCERGYEASVYDKTSGRKIRRVLPDLAAARAWQTDARSGVQRGTLRPSSAQTIREAAEELIAGMRSGAVRTRSGDPYKPATLRAYDESLRLHVLEPLGAMRLGDVKRRHVQRLADGLTAEGASPSTVRNAILPLRVIYRRAIRDDAVSVSPCEHLDLPAVRGRRDRVVSSQGAAALVAVLDLPDRAVWTTALYAGLRRGELMALRWQDVDLANGALAVERSYDPKEKTYVAPKSRSGVRRVPIPGALRDELLALRARLGDSPMGESLVFGYDGRPFDDEALALRARKVWEAAGLEPISLHEARHTAASLMIAAGVNVKALSEFLGHASITITLDLYGHLLPGSLAESASLLDAFLVRTGDVTGDALAIPLQIGDLRRS
jgi:integrase